jgi:hypothetical protein
VKQPTEAEWKLASLLADEHKLFVLWNVRSQLCRNLSDFQKHYGPGFPTTEMVDELKEDGFLSGAGSEFQVTRDGMRALEYLDEPETDWIPHDEADAVAEMRKILMDISSAAITTELSRAKRNRAENIYQAFSFSSAVADVYRRILIASRPAPMVEPEPCRVLRENLTGAATAKTIVAALKASGFYRNPDVSSRELDCFRNAIHGALQTLRASYEITDSTDLARVQLRLDSLREVLDALPPNIEAPRREVEKIIYTLELKSAQARFAAWVERLGQRVEAQDFADLERHELQVNLWAQEHPTEPEVVTAQKHFARLEELHHAFQTQKADADRVRDLIDLHEDYDQALNEIRLIDARLQETGLRNRQPLDSVVDHLIDKLEQDYAVHERAGAESTPIEALLEASLSNLGRIAVQLQKVPETYRERTDRIYSEAEALSEELAAKLNKLRLHTAREGLRRTSVEGVPAYIRELRLSGLPGLSEWARRVELVFEALEQVKRHESVDSIYLARLENAEENLGTAPLTRAAKETVQEWRDTAALDYLFKVEELVETLEIEAIEKLALNHLNPTDVSEGIFAVVEKIVQYGRYQESELFSETQRKYGDRYKAMDQRVLRVRQEVLPKAVRSWAKLVVKNSSSQADITAARQSFVAWLDVLGADLPRAEIERALDERSAEIEIKALLAAGKFDEGLKLIEDKSRLLSSGFTLEFTRLLGRRKALALFQPGREAEIAEAIKQYGPDSELLRIVVDDFVTQGQCDHLAAIYGCLDQIEPIDRHTAQLVRWVFEFKSGVLKELVQSLSDSEDTETVLAFSKGLANSIHHAPALRVLKVALKDSGHWPAEIRIGVEASYVILSDKFAETVAKIELALLDLVRRSESDEHAVVADTQNDTLLQQEIEAAFARAKAFLNASLASVENWLSYLTNAARFEVELDPSLRKRVQELDAKLRTNAHILERLDAARRAVETHGWVRLEDLRKALNILIVTVPAVAAVVKLLNRYLENYRPTTELVGELKEAWKSGGAGLSSAQLTNIVNRLTVELKYDFRTGQDRFKQLQRLSDRSFQEFIDELRVMVAEVEAVSVYQERLLSAMTGKEDRLRLRIERNLPSDREEIFEFLRQPDSLGQSILHWYSNPPDTSHSSVARERLQALQNVSWFELLRTAVNITKQLKNKESTQDLIADL